MCLPSRSGHGRRETVEETDLSVPRWLRKQQGQVGDTTAGIWVIKRQQPSALSRTLSRALYTTVPPVIAGQVKHKNNRRTTEMISDFSEHRAS